MKFNFKNIIKQKSYFLPVLFFLILILYASRKFLLSRGIILYGEFFGSTDYLFFFKEMFSAWNDYTTLGHSNIGFPEVYGQNPTFWISNVSVKMLFLPLLTVLQILIDEFAPKIYLLSAISLPFLGMYLLALYWFDRFRKNPVLHVFMASLSGLIYAINPIMESRIEAGHLSYNLAFGLLPILLLSVIKYVHNKTKKNSLIFYLTVLISGFMAWLMPHLLYLFFFFLFFYFILFVFPDFTKLIRLTVISAGIALGAVILNISAWLPAIFFSEQYPLAMNLYYDLAYVYSLTANIILTNLITLQNFSDQKIVDTQTYAKIVLMKSAVPLIAIIGIFLNFELRRSLFLIFLSIIGIVFTMGVQPPFEVTYTFLFKYVFLFKPFRDTSKFLILYIFSLSLLFPCILLIIEKFNKKILSVFFGSLVIFVLYLNPSFTSGNFGNTIIPVLIPKKYILLKNELNKEKEEYRVAIYPNEGYISSNEWYPKNAMRGTVYYNVFNSILPLDKSLAISNRTVSDYTSRYLDFIEANMDKVWAMNRLGGLRVKYIIVDNSHAQSMQTINNLNKNNALTKIEKKIDGFTFYLLNNYDKNNIKNQKAAYYYGDVNGVEKIPAEITLINLDLNPTDILDKNLSDYIILYSSNLNDVFLNSLKRFNFSFFPEIRFTKNETKKFYLPWEYLRGLTTLGISYSNPEIIATTGKSNFSKKSKLDPGRYKIFIRIYNSEFSTNSLKLSLDSSILVKSSFNNNEESFKWMEIGEIDVKQKNPVFVIENLEDKGTYIDYVLIVPEKSYTSEKNKFYSIVKNKKIFILNENNNYSLDSLLSKKITVIPQSYSPYWNICNSETFMVDFFAIGSACQKNQDIKPKFKPENFYKFSLFLSYFLYLSVIIKILFILKRKG